MKKLEITAQFNHKKWDKKVKLFQVSNALLARQFLDESANQLTYHGLVSLMEKVFLVISLPV